MKVDHNTLKYLSVGLDSGRNSSKAQKAEPDAFGQLFASMAQTSQKAQAGAAESAPTAHLTSKTDEGADDQAKVETRDAEERRGEKQGDEADVVRQSAAEISGIPGIPGAAEVKAEREDMKERSDAGEKGVVRDSASAKPQAAGVKLEQDVKVHLGMEGKGIDGDSASAKLQAEGEHGKAEASTKQATDTVLSDAVEAGSQEQAVEETYADAARRRAAIKDATVQVTAGQKAAGGETASAKLQAAEEQRQTTATNAAQGATVNVAAAQNVQTGVSDDGRDGEKKPAEISAARSGGADSAAPSAAAPAPATMVGATATGQAPHGTTMSGANAALAQGQTTLTDAEAQHVAQQALGSVRSLAAPGSGQGAVTLRLNPPELGALRISVRMDGPMLSATFEASNAAVSTLLQKQMHSLRTALEHAGLGVEQLNVQSPSPLPTANGAQFGSAQQQMHQSASDGRSRGWMGDGGRQPGGQQQPREQTTTSPSFQRELLDLVA